MTVRPTVTLTFDNGPDPGVTPEVLDTLRERGLRATFFVVGTQLQRDGAVEVMRQAVADGHWIGNHTWTHSTPLGEVTEAAATVAEIEATQDLIGSCSHPDRLFRPFGSGGAIDARLLSPVALGHLRAGAYTCVLWNCVPRDWEDPTGWVDTCLHEVSTRPWSVVVLHDLPTGAMARLGEFLDRLDSLRAQVVQEFPDDCVLLRRGEATPALATFPMPVMTMGGE